MIVAVDGVVADESVRRDTTLEKLAELKPVFDPEGTTTAGNAPGVNDGASCVIVTSEEFARRRGLEVLATILSQAYVADDFAYLARTPARAGGRALDKAGKAMADVKRVEINEAFAAIAIVVARELGLPEDIVNVEGGAIAHGHPIGATGAILTTRLICSMRRDGLKRGLVTLCIGGGQGIALALETVS